jgi:hypothetical protein
MSVVLDEKLAQAAPEGGAQDPYVRVKSVIGQVLESEKPHQGILKAIIADLQDLVERAERVRKLAPELCGVDVSPYVYKMLKMADRLPQA